jgi:hypothetical protein
VIDFSKPATCVPPFGVEIIFATDRLENNEM